MTKTLLRMDAMLGEIELLTKRAKVMVDEVDQGYFSYDLKSPNDAWRLAQPFYETAGIKMGIANSILYEMLEQLKELRDALDKMGEEK